MSMKIRLNRKGMEEVFTDCASLGQNCLQVHSDFMNQDEVLTSIIKYEGPTHAKFKYGEWMTIEEPISFRADELDPTNIYLMLRVAGGETGADIELQEFSLQISPQDACSTSPPDCQDLVVCNGDAEFGMMPSPFHEKGEVQISVGIEDGYHFWRVYREEASSVLSGIEWNVPVDCIKEHAVYRFKMRIRVNPDESHPDPISTSVYIRSIRAGSSGTQ
jgi:hypothetical protein